MNPIILHALYIAFHLVASNQSTNFTDPFMHAIDQSSGTNIARRLLFTQTGNEDIVSCPNLGSETCICPNAGQTLGKGCILRCLGDDQCKSSVATCRRGDECSVECNGKGACTSSSFHNLARSTCLSVSCIGEDSWYFILSIPLSQ